jgi:ribose/xylose/arabinose/galactoside ABC-type transport system permease subunit
MIRRILASRETILLLILIGLCIFFSVFVEGFSDLVNVVERSRYWVVPGMIAVPMTFIIATGGIDLSVGGVISLGTSILATQMHSSSMAFWLIAVLVIGAALGAAETGSSSVPQTKYAVSAPESATQATTATTRRSSAPSPEHCALVVGWH